MDPVLDTTVTKIIADHKHSPDALWTALELQGLTSILLETNTLPAVADQYTSVSAPDFFGLLQLYGSVTESLPLCEHLLACWLLNAAGIVAPAGKLTLGLPDQITLHNASILFETDACAAVADHVVWLSDDATATQINLSQIDDRGDITTTKYDQSASLTLSPPSICSAAPSWLHNNSVNAMGALMRACQMSGAMSSVLELTLQYAREREQFGRPLGRFQAIQHMLCAIAAESAAAAAALNKAIDEFDVATLQEPVVIAIAKVRTSEAVQLVTANAHQIHGALGYTDEYALAYYSRKLWQWRNDYGCEFYWSTYLGKRMLAGNEHCDCDENNLLINALLGEINE